MTTCQHEGTEMRLRTLSNGSTAIHMQCSVCGEPTSPAIKKSSITASELAALPAFDNELRERYRAAELNHNREERERQNQQWEKESHARKAEYSAYLASPEWRGKRAMALARDNGMCQGCLRAPATEVHHLTYAHRGNELLFELISLCAGCHERCHTP